MDYTIIYNGNTNIGTASVLKVTSVTIGENVKTLSASAFGKNALNGGQGKCNRKGICATR